MADLRLDAPWPELIDLAASYDLDNMDPSDYVHVPYIILLLKYLDVWRQQHDGAGPVTYKDRNELKVLINSGRRYGDQENFDEALAAVWRLGQSSKLSPDVEAILEHGNVNVDANVSKVQRDKKLTAARPNQMSNLVGTILDPGCCAQTLSVSPRIKRTPSIIRGPARYES